MLIFGTAIAERHLVGSIWLIRGESGYDVNDFVLKADELSFYETVSGSATSRRPVLRRAAADLRTRSTHARVFDNDRIEAKYLNTFETPIYTKPHILYGIDLARKDIARKSAGSSSRATPT